MILAKRASSAPEPPTGLLIRVLQQPILDQPSHSAVPRFDGAHAKTGLLIEDDGTGSGVADLKPNRVFHPADSRHETH
jgi:hypothetical protein